MKRKEKTGNLREEERKGTEWKGKDSKAEKGRGGEVHGCSLSENDPK